MKDLIVSLVLCLTILQVCCNTNCYHKEFVHDSPNDNLLLETGLLLEVNISSRLECVSLSHFHGGCNLILYNPSSSLCRLHHYDHTNDTDAVITGTGWENYAHRCTGPEPEPDCNITDASVLDSCQSCFYDNAWRDYDMCIAYKLYLKNTGGNTVSRDLDFDLEAGMIILVKGPDIDPWVGVYLEDGNSDLAIDLDFANGYCDTFTGSDEDICDDVMPQGDPSRVAITFRLGNNTTQIFVDRTFIIQYQIKLRRIFMDIYGFEDAHVQIIRTPDSCNQP